MTPPRPLDANGRLIEVGNHVSWLLPCAVGRASLRQGEVISILGRVLTVQTDRAEHRIRADKVRRISKGD